MRGKVRWRRAAQFHSTGRALTLKFDGIPEIVVQRIHAIWQKGGAMKFKVLEAFNDGDLARLKKAIISVDPDAKVAADVRANTVDIDSWLFAEEFLVAFHEVGYDVRIAQR
ncbi:MAG TPA: hypothetical protein VJU59_17750 [Paraburkholderia sp.]|uniref:hypothetical protein n=1 Tax=Paraburkholderia sp. TaxID=1926495 RepID=UPI002B46EFE7|nr:hypothetical protein [Paraburkholderia sp.]HKR41491.1 hypothetical protein [Paraburkholderia sp.]